MNMGAVFAERKGSYLNEFTLFLAHFNSIPNFIHEIDIDCKKANAWFLETYKEDIKDLYFDKRYCIPGFFLSYVKCGERIGKGQYPD